MCGRFALTLPDDAMAQLFAARPANDLPPLPNYNICPTNRVHAVWSGEGGRRLGAMRWGFLPHWYKSVTDGPLLINARAETIANKPAFARAAREGRCLVPASGFYEWTKDDEGARWPWYIHPAQEALFAFAGIWQDWEGPDGPIRSCAIVTCAASPAIAHIHHRMPVVVAQPDWALWLGEAGHGAAAVMRPGPGSALASHRVGREVNSNRATGPRLVEPVG